MRSSRFSIAYIIAAITVAVWGETFVSSKILLEHGLRAADIMFLRFLIAYAGMWLFSHDRIRSNSWKDELTMLLLGVSGGSLYFLLENTALDYSTASNVAIIISSTPLVTAILMSLIYRDERIRKNQILGSIISLIGLSLIVFNGEVILRLNPKGDLLAFGAVVCWGIYSIFIKTVSGRYDVRFVTRKVFGYGLLSILPMFAIQGLPDFSPLAQSVVWGHTVYLGVVASLACFLSWNWSISKLGAVKATNLIYLQPFFAMLISHFVLGDRITWMAILGAAILILGMVQLQSKK